MARTRCPYCRKMFTGAEGSPWGPFCSERCQQLDLGQWLNEGYSVPVETERVAREVEFPEDERNGAAHG